MLFKFVLIKDTVTSFVNEEKVAVLGVNRSVDAGIALQGSENLLTIFLF